MEVIDINRKVFSKVKEFEVREDVIVPDNKPDIVNIIDTSSISYAYKMEQTNEKVKLDGNIESYISYLSVDGGTRGIQTTINFVDILEETQIKEESFIKYKIDTVKVENKVLNERKLSLTFTLKVEYNVYEKQKIEFNNDFSNIENIQKMESKITVNSLLGIGISKASLKEDIKIDDMDKVAEILKVQLSTKKSEYKISYNKVLAKAEEQVNIIYLTEDDRISSVQASLPVMSFIEMNNIKEGDICNIDYQIKNILIKPNNTENHSITTQIEFEISAEGYVQKELNIVSDIYSLTNDLEFNSKNIEIENRLNASNVSVNIDEKIEVEDIKKILEVEANAKVLKNAISGSTSNIEGEVELKLYYEASSESGLKVKEATVPFITKADKLEEATVSIVNKEFDINDKNVILKMELMLTDENCANQTVTVIENVEVKPEKQQDDCSMVIYLVKPKDTIWKIAKKFKTTMENIIKINDLENPDLIYPGDKLYVMK